jgi:hypothetical protein
VSSNEFYADNSLGISVDRSDNESGDIVITITANGDTITINAGRFQDDADQLLRELEGAAGLARDIAENWEDRPDSEGDGFVYETRDGYTVSLEGIQVKCDYNRFGAFPSREIAEYELAKHMAESGVFPGAWYVNERGNYDAINDAVNAFSGGDDKIKPLPGVQYEEGQDVIHASTRWTVVKDYGSDLGVVASFYGEETRLFEHDELTPYDDEEGED